MCGELMLQGQRLALDHIVPRALGGQTTRSNVRIVHYADNHRAGSQLGNAMQQARRSQTGRGRR
jgi:5-methylcytosine-specific restriction endonuclease McrA